MTIQTSTQTSTQPIQANGTPVVNGTKAVSGLHNAASVRAAARSGTLRGVTAGLCPGQVQANLLILPARYADDFRNLCHRNPVPCPLLAESCMPGDVGFAPGVADGTDITTDVPGYNVYRDGELVEGDIATARHVWQEDSVAFLIGCSFTFEDALLAAGMGVRHIENGKNVPMYNTSVRLMPAGVFSGCMVVSMRPFPAADIDRVRDITRPYSRAHGEPVAWGWDGAAALGITDVHNPEYGDAPELRDGEVPVFWACGVTPQLVVMNSGVSGTIVGHGPGKMFCLDWEAEQVF